MALSAEPSSSADDSPPARRSAVAGGASPCHSRKATDASNVRDVNTTSVTPPGERSSDHDTEPSTDSAAPAAVSASSGHSTEPSNHRKAPTASASAVKNCVRKYTGLASGRVPGAGRAVETGDNNSRQATMPA